MVPCCNFFYKKDDFGTLEDGSFDDVWNGSTYRESRVHMADGNIEALNPTCRNCEIFTDAAQGNPLYVRD